MTIKLSQMLEDKNVTTLSRKQSLVWQRPDFLVVLMAAIYLVVGLLVVTQYSESVDEPPRMQYAGRSISAYLGKTEYLVDEKGPFYGMIALIGAKSLIHLHPDWILLDGWHFMTFVSFIFGVYFFYRLCRRLLDVPPAFAATLLFSSQPLLWGHAFINPKDIPFMSFFMASVCLGLEMVDHVQARLASGEKQSLRSELSVLRLELASEWASASGRLRKLMKIVGWILAAISLSYWPVQGLIAFSVTQIYIAPDSSWLGRLFHQAALHANQIPVQNYISKAQNIYFRGAFGISIGLVLAGAILSLIIFSSVRNRIVHVLYEPRVWLAGCFIGFCSDIRTLGPASAMLVAVYFIFKSGRRAIPYLLEYFGVSALSIFAFWPYLWANPIHNFISSLTQAADFPWNGYIMFAGNIYTQGTQPDSYLPFLFTVQFTETALVLILTGIILAGFYLVGRAKLRLDVLLLGAWFVAPVAAAILMHSIVYNNFRQFLFVVPPLFVFAGLALQEIWIRLKRKQVLFVLLTALIVLPGLYWDWQLHPYQYIYYNNLVGGVAGASRQYDLDYWNSAYREALAYLNKVAPENSKVAFWRNKRIAMPYSRPDIYLTIISKVKDPANPKIPLDYVILSTQDNTDLLCFPDSKEIYKVQRGGATLAVIKQVAKGDIVKCK